MRTSSKWSTSIIVMSVFSGCNVSGDEESSLAEFVAPLGFTFTNNFERDVYNFGRQTNAVHIWTGLNRSGEGFSASNRYYVEPGTQSSFIPYDGSVDYYATWADTGAPVGLSLQSRDTGKGRPIHDLSVGEFTGKQLREETIVGNKVMEHLDTPERQEFRYGPFREPDDLGIEPLFEPVY